MSLPPHTSNSQFGRGLRDDLPQYMNDPVDITALCVYSSDSHVTAQVIR